MFSKLRNGVFIYFLFYLLPPTKCSCLNPPLITHPSIHHLLDDSLTLPQNYNSRLVFGTLCSPLLPVSTPRPTRMVCTDSALPASTPRPTRMVCTDSSLPASTPRPTRMVCTDSALPASTLPHTQEVIKQSNHTAGGISLISYKAAHIAIIYTIHHPNYLHSIPF